jgi:hypothetical protein
VSTPGTAFHQTRERDPLWDASTFQRELDKKFSSQALRDRVLTAFDNFGRQHEITAEEARILLMDTGVRL